MKIYPCLLAALAALACAGTARAQPAAPALGRLFSTPAERAALDAQRSGAAPVAEAAVPAPPPPLSLDGVVRRSSGKSTVWLNQVPQDDQRNTFLKARPGTLSLRTESGRKVLLKPGQRYDGEQGVVTDAYAQ